MQMKTWVKKVQNPGYSLGCKRGRRKNHEDDSERLGGVEAGKGGVPGVKSMINPATTVDDKDPDS